MRCCATGSAFLLKHDGAYLATRHGYARLKIGYLLEVAAARCGLADVYALDEVGIAELLVLGLEMYCMTHHFQRHVSIESLRRAGVTAELATLLPRCRAYPVSPLR